MKYMGSKARYAKEILPIMSYYKKPEQWWVEPFVGGGNLIDKLNGPRIGADSNRYTIEALKSIQNHAALLPTNNREFTEQDYKALRIDDSYPHKGFAGFAYSYSGKWLGGWARDKNNKRDYVKEAYRNAIKQQLGLMGVILYHAKYEDLIIPDNSLIYCDPPYAGTTKYKDAFDHARFWVWCDEKVEEGHTVFVSEYNAPTGWECVWQKQVNSSLTKNTGAKQAIEKLFTKEKKS